MWEPFLYEMRREQRGNSIKTTKLTTQLITFVYNNIGVKTTNKTLETFLLNFEYE